MLPSSSTSSSAVAAGVPEGSTFSITFLDVGQGVAYIGNKRSMKFHLPTCKSLPKEENRVYLDSREQAIGRGYKPCGNCNP